MIKLCVVTGTRAEFGLIKPLIDKINNDKELELQLVVTGAHLSPEFGLTFREIEKESYAITEKVEILLSSDTSVGITKSMGLALIGFGEVFERLEPDFIIIPGDRYEMLSVSIAAVISNIPVIHLNGGETTEGAVDEYIRHSITKQSFLHFTSANENQKRVIQLGEHPDRVFNVGSLGVEVIKNTKMLSRSELEESIKFDLSKPYTLCTFHPTTLENATAKEQFLELLKAFAVVKDNNIIFTKANADKDGRIINRLIDQFVKENPDRAISFTSLGQIRYLSAMKHCDFVIGNSSSGITEAPSFKVPTINIGDRQRGRVQAKSIVNCAPKCEEIIKAMNKVNSLGFKKEILSTVSPYGDGIVSEKIIKIIKKMVRNKDIDLKKKFYDY